MKKSFLSLGCAVITVALGLFEQTSAAAIFPAQGDDTMSSMGVFRLMVAPAFRPLLAPAPPTFTSGYPGYRSADGRLTSPALLDSATTVGRSAPHDRVLAGSVPVGLPSMGNLGYADYPATPALFASAPAPTREILTQIRSFALAALRDKCPPDPRVPTVPLNWVMVKAGPNQGVALNSIGMVQENVANGAADPDFPAKSFFDIFVEVSLPAVPGTVSSTVFPVTGASLYNDSPLIITNLNLSSLPPNVVYIHGETTAVPLKFKNNNPPYWNAGDVFGYLVLAGHGTQTDCSSESAFLDAVLGPIGTSRPELPIEWPFPNPLCPPTSSSYNSVRDVDIVNFGNVRVRNFIHTNLVNSIAPPPLNGSATYNAGNTLVTLEVSSDGGNTWSPAQANGQVAVGINHTSDSGNTGIFDTEMFQLNLNGNSPFGPFMIRESPTLQSLGKHTIRPSSPEYLVSGFFDVFLELSIDGGQTWIPANRSIRVQLTPPVTNPGIPIVVTCSADITVTATSAAGAVVTYSSSASGGCSPPVVNCNPPSGSTFPIGITTVTCTASDSCGNTARCNFKVTVRLPVEVDYFSNTTAQVTLQKPDGTTETVLLSGPTEVHVMIGPDGTGPAVTSSGGLDRVPTEMVLLRLGGNSSMGPVTVNLNPSLPTVGEIKETVNSNLGRVDVDPFTPGGTATSFFDVFLVVNVGAQTLHNSQPIHMASLIHHKPPAPGDKYVNPFTAPIPLYDASGTLTGFSLREEVHTPNPPTNPPPVMTCSSNITVTATSAAGAVVTYTSSASGGCPPVTVNCNPPSGSTFPIGTTTVTCTASDACGNSATCNFTVTVNLRSPISLACSSNITVTATSAAGAVVTYTGSASGGCPPVTIICNPPSGSTFPIGTTTVTCTASDACGQTTNCTFTVTVVRPPVTIQVIGNQLRVIWSDGTLQESDKVEGPFIDVDPQPTSPLNVTPTDAKKFFRVRAGQPGSGFTFYDTEMLQLDISGGSLPAGMMLRESPTLASTGKTAISPAPGGGFVIDSFFDVFTELSMDGGQTWQVSTGAPPRMRFTGNAPTNTVPPREAQYVSPEQWHALYAQGIYITNASHLGFLGSFPPPPPGGVSDTHGFGSTVNMLVRPCPTCPYQPVSAPAQVTVRVTSRP